MCTCGRKLRTANIRSGDDFGVKLRRMFPHVPDIVLRFPEPVRIQHVEGRRRKAAQRPPQMLV
jgi:hypothetical protein